MEEKLISEEEAVRDVRIVAERLAMLYYYFVKNLARELGEEKALELTDKVIAEYGADCGLRAKAAVEEQGYPVDLAHHHFSHELPGHGWQGQTVEMSEDSKVFRTDYCPFAAVWLEYGRPDWGRHYCWVDQAKFAAYDENLCAVHECNLLDGDDHCLLKVEQIKKQAGR